MTKKTRFLILLSCVVCFFIISPYIVLYSLGYRINISNGKIVATGGIYIRTSPQADKILIDSKIQGKPSMFNGSVFVQSLLPTAHTLLVKKDGYYDYYKLLPVQEKEVTKLENVLLIKKDIIFGKLAEKADYFSVSPDGKNIVAATSNSKDAAIKFFSVDNPAVPQTFSLAQAGKMTDIKWASSGNTALLQLQTSNALLYFLFDPQKQSKNITAVSALNKSTQNIQFNPQNNGELFYLKNKTIYSFSLTDNVPQALISNALSYTLSNGSIVWLSADGVLSASDYSGNLTRLFASQGFPADMAGYKLLSSPDNKNLIYYNDKTVYLYSFAENLQKNNVKIFSGQNISSVFWLNNDYIVFSAQGLTTISEIDYRGNINAVSLPQTAQNTQMFFSQPSNKIYILANGSLLVSEKVTP